MMRRLRARKTGLICLRWIMVLVATASVYGQSQSRSYVEFQPLETVAVTPGKTTPVALTFHIKSGFHINSNKPLTEELIPTSLGFTPPADIVISKVQYPPGELTSFPFDPTQKLSVYSGDVVIKAVIITQPKAPAGSYTIQGEFKYQACDNNACYPPKKLPVQFDVKVGPSPKRRAAVRQ